MPRVTIDVDEQGSTCVSVDGVIIGCVRSVRFEMDSSRETPTMRISIHTTSKVSRQLVDHLRTVPWVEVEELPCGED